MKETCLNCGTELNGKFCAECGQRASTHRITLSKFLEHDLIHGIFHVDRGVLHTLRSLFYRPGYAAREFLLGQRIRHYNIFTLFIIVIAVKVFVDTKTGYDLVINSYDNDAADVRANHVIDTYYKVFYLLSLPVTAAFTFLLFRSLRLNYLEHIVGNCFLLTGCFIYALLFSLAELVVVSEQVRTMGYYALWGFYFVGLYQYSRPEYSFWSYLWRALIIFAFCALLLFAGTVLFLQYHYGTFRGVMTYERLQP